MSESTPTYEFDEILQRRLLSMLLRDEVFRNRTEGLIKPEYFEKNSHGYIANLITSHIEKYKEAPTQRVVVDIIKADRANKRLRDDLKDDVVKDISQIYRDKLEDREYLIKGAVKFAQRQAYSKAIMDAAVSLDKGEFDGIVQTIQSAASIGEVNAVEYNFIDMARHRKKLREEEAAGVRVRDGITTGNRIFDKLLRNRGWGRSELTLYMGGAKAGKTAALLHHAVAAAKAGHATLFLSLEVSEEIIAERMDANISGVPMDQLFVKANKVLEECEKASKAMGPLIIREYPSRTFSVLDLRRLLKGYENKGIFFDFVVVDYVDLMRAGRKRESYRLEVGETYVELRALAQEMKFACLSATQTNREGAKAELATQTDVGEDYSKMQTADLAISINADENEKDAGIARLFLAASRNQREVTIEVKRDLACMRHIVDVLNVNGRAIS